MLKSWDDDKEPVCNHRRPACESCIIEYTLALVKAHREFMLREIWDTREALTAGEGTVRQILDGMERIEESTGEIHNLIEKALERDPRFHEALRTIREKCRCALPW